MSELLDESTLQQLEALGAEALGQIIERYRADLSARLAELAEALGREDAERAGDLLHAMKGASLTVGAREVAALCKAAEADARALDWAALSADFRQRLSDQADQAVAALRARLPAKA